MPDPLPADPYFLERNHARSVPAHQKALERCLARLEAVMPVVGLRNPKIGREDLTWDYCGPFDWVIGFHSGQLWLASQLAGSPVFAAQARARRSDFRRILENPAASNHDLGFQFSLSCVADWQMTGDPEARAMALKAAEALAGRFHPEGGYLQAWTPRPGNPASARLAAGRAIADTMMNLPLLYWAAKETGRPVFREVAGSHAALAADRFVRPDGSSCHTFLFDPASGEPLREETYQGYSDTSCWTRGHAWMLHGFAQCHRYTGDPLHLETALRLAARAEELMGEEAVPPWDLALPPEEPRWCDSSAGAILASGLYLLAGAVPGAGRARWTAFADRLLAGLLETCDLTSDPRALGFLAHGAAHVRAERCDQMLPYGDYFLMEALMRSLGHDRFFW